MYHEVFSRLNRLINLFDRKILGKIRETRYKWPEKKRQKLEKICEEDLKKNEVSGINDEAGLHLIENPSTAERAISLHLYYPPLSECLGKLLIFLASYSYF